MGKQTNQYTKTRTAATTQSDDLLDIDSTEDTGTTFESAKMKVSELLAYINANVDNLYNADGSTGTRNVTIGNNTLSFIGGKIRFKSTGGDIPFSLDNSSGVERVKIEYFATSDSGALTLSNAAGTFFRAYDGTVETNTYGAASLESNLYATGTNQTLYNINADALSQSGTVAVKIKVTNESGYSADDALLSLGGNVQFYGSGDNNAFFFKYSNGRTGFGKSNPSEKVDVEGSINVLDVYKVGGVSGFTGTGTYTNFTIVGGIITAAS